MMIRLSSMKIALLISKIYSRISLEQMKTAVKNVLEPEKLEHTIINPLFGYMFKVNGCLESIRFFSPELRIKYDATGERIYSRDTSDDSLTNLLIQIFPSHTGALNNFRGVDLNFTRMYFIKYKNKTERTANIEMLENVFFKLVKKQADEKIEKVSKNTKDLFKLLEYYALSPSTFPGLDNKIFKLLTIHAYAVDIFDTPDDLEIYLNSILKKLEGAGNAIIHLDLSKEQKKLFEHLYANKFKFPYSIPY